MSGRKILFLSSLAILLLSAYVPSAYAVDIPDFPACTNPQGEIIASYDSGTHGVPGNTSQFLGSDVVYSVGENNVQCLCQDNGQGTQTNWLKASGLTQDEINILVSQDWILIADGTSWGLDPSPYLAKNTNYRCIGSEGASATNTSSSTGGGAGETSSIDTILNLASTGNILFILLTFASGAGLLALGLIPNLKKRN